MVAIPFFLASNAKSIHLFSGNECKSTRRRATSLACLCAPLWNVVVLACLIGHTAFQPLASAIFVIPIMKFSFLKSLPKKIKK